ncbi:MAG TPA: class I SAM-dependent methyltransferase [Burkholderiales bacterium]|nr:class I SAM-dependent methyltransferase [Burkholderiales bacterium]
MQVASNIRQIHKRMWTVGDFSKIAPAYVIVSENLCESAGLRAGQSVLDVATGSGNTAIAAARRWCKVTGVDFVPALLDKAAERAATEGLEIDFRAADAEQLPFADASFDVVLSTFGSMFAIDQEKAAAELLRVCKPGGRVCMANWAPEGFMSDVFQQISAYAPPPPDVRPPMLWGTENALRRLFAGGITDLRVRRRSVGMRYLSPEHWLEQMRAYSGPIALFFSVLPEGQQRSLARDLLDLAHRHNNSGDSSFYAPADYLEVIAQRR